MPFDGIEFNQVTEQLRAAKEMLIRNGWCVGKRVNEQGQHCALGALQTVREGWVDELYCPVIKRLADAIPKDFSCKELLAPSKVAVYNNLQTDIKPILEWFDRAIG